MLSSLSQKNIFVKFVRVVVEASHKSAQIITNYFSSVFLGKNRNGASWGVYRIRAVRENGSYPACYILRIILVVDFVVITQSLGKHPCSVPCSSFRWSGSREHHGLRRE